MHILISLLLGILPALPQSQLIDWSASRRLTWDDFKGTPDFDLPNAALTHSSITIDYGYDEKELEYGLQCRFNKVRSWVKLKSDIVLAHEQGHFDIAELHARQLNKALKAYTFNFSTVSADVNAIYNRVMQQHHAMQNEYDRETDFSRNKEKQEAWLKKIAAGLKALEGFADYKKKVKQSDR